MKAFSFAASTEITKSACHCTTFAKYPPSASIHLHILRFLHGQQTKWRHQSCPNIGGIGIPLKHKGALVGRTLVYFQD